MDTTIISLEDHLLFDIMNLLDTRDLFALRATCRKFYHIFDHAVSVSFRPHLDDYNLVENYAVLKSVEEDLDKEQDEILDNFREYVAAIQIADYEGYPDDDTAVLEYMADR